MANGTHSWRRWIPQSDREVVREPNVLAVESWYSWTPRQGCDWGLGFSAQVGNVPGPQESWSLDLGGDQTPLTPTLCRTGCWSGLGCMQLTLDGTSAWGMFQSALASLLAPNQPSYLGGNHCREVSWCQELSVPAPPTSWARSSFPSQADWDIIHPIFHNDCNPSSVYSSIAMLQLEPRALNIQMMPLAELMLQKVNCQHLLYDLCSLFPTDNWSALVWSWN